MYPACGAFGRPARDQERRLPGRYTASIRSVAATSEIRIVSMNASKALTPMAQRTSHRISPNVVARMTPIRARTLASGSAQGPRHLRHDLVDRGRRVPRLAGGPDQPAADDDTVGAGAGGLRRVLGRRDPE